MHCGNSYQIVKDDKIHAKRFWFLCQFEFYHLLDDSGLVSSQNENCFVLHMKEDRFIDLFTFSLEYCYISTSESNAPWTFLWHPGQPAQESPHAYKQTLLPQ